MRRNLFLLLLFILSLRLLSSSSARAEAAFEAPATASELGLMKGFPPPADKQVTRSNFMGAPQNRWSLLRIRELQPTREIYRGTGPVTPLVSAAVALDDLEVKVSGGRTVTVSRWQREAYTDAMVVLHRGELDDLERLGPRVANRPKSGFCVTLPRDLPEAPTERGRWVNHCEAVWQQYWD